MLDALYISAVGLEAQQQQLNTAAGNFANVGTTAFKRQAVDFAALLDRAPSGQAAEPVGRSGTRATHVDWSRGEIRGTGRALDVAILGGGFLEVRLPGERLGYSRAGALQIAADGTLGLAGGQPLAADVRIPSDASEVRILTDGSITALLAGDSEPTVLGQIELASFANPEVLDYRGDGIFVLPGDAPEPLRTRPGEQGTELLAPRSLENSNVDLTDEVVSLTLIQRVYELNSRVVQVADELMGMANNLRRT